MTTGSTGLLRLLVLGVVGVLVVGSAWVAGADDRPAEESRRTTLDAGWRARAGGPQVLGGELHPGVPGVQRLEHDEVDFTVSVGPQQPGRNVVRVDVAGPHHGARAPRVRVGTDEDHLVAARPRPGVDGLWATVGLPPGEGTVLVTHGPEHRIPFPVVTGTGRSASESWDGPDAPECLAAALGRRLAGSTARAGECPSDSLSDADVGALRATVWTIADRGTTQLAVGDDVSARSRAAREVVTEAATERGLEVVDPAARPGSRNALLDVSGWQHAARNLAAVSRRPLREQPIRSHGTWLAPWLLSPGVVDSTSGAVLPLDFDVRGTAPLQYAGLLGRFLPQQAPTASGYRAWLEETGAAPDELRLYAASRTAYMPATAGHTSHETRVPWFPGGTITPVGLPIGDSTR